MTNTWTLDDGREIRLLTLKEYQALPDGTALLAIDGVTLVKGQPDEHGRPIDLDTRRGLLAFGVAQGLTE